MRNQERIDRIRQFKDLAEEKIHTADTDVLIGLAVVLTGHVKELLDMLDDTGSKVWTREVVEKFFRPTIPREEPNPMRVSAEQREAAREEVGKFLDKQAAKMAFDKTGMYDEPTARKVAFYPKDYGIVEIVGDEPTADEVLKHVRSCDFRRGLKVCTCIK